MSVVFFTFGVGELLDGGDGVRQERGFPFGKVMNPIVIDMFDTGDAVLGNFF